MSDLSDAVETANAVLEWERERNPDLGSRELAQRLINQIVTSGCVVPASEVERLTEAIGAVAQQMKEDGDDYVLDYAKRLEDALNPSDAPSTVPST